MSRMQAGFTLLEMVISMTIISLVVLVMYQAFSSGTMIWNRQDVEGEFLRRQDAVMRLIREDIRNLRPYSFRLDTKEGNFFAASGKSMFYVTTQGFGSPRRTENTLFFTCIFAVPTSTAVADDSLQTPDLARDTVGGEAGGTSYSLYICKTDRPQDFMLEEVLRFAAMSATDQTHYTPPDSIRSRSVLLLPNIASPEFTFEKEEAEDLKKPEETWDPDASEATDPLKAAVEAVEEASDTMGAPSGDADSKTKTWIEEDFPSRIRFVYTDSRRHHVIDAQPGWEMQKEETSS